MPPAIPELTLLQPSRPESSRPRRGRTCSGARQLSLCLAARGHTMGLRMVVGADQQRRIAPGPHPPIEPGARGLVGTGDQLGGATEVMRPHVERAEWRNNVERAVASVFLDVDR